MKKTSPKQSSTGERRAHRWSWLALATLVATSLVALVALASAEPANAAGLHLKDRYGHSVRVSSGVVAKLGTKHNLTVPTLAVWLPRSRLADATGTRKEYSIRLVRVRCETFPIIGRLCWRTNERLVLLSVVDYRINSQGVQQGLITAYCLGMVRCPAWVNRPVAGAGGFFAGGGSGGGGGGGW